MPKIPLSLVAVCNQTTLFIEKVKKVKSTIKFSYIPYTYTYTYMSYTYTEFQIPNSAEKQCHDCVHANTIRCMISANTYLRFTNGIFFFSDKM